MNDGWQISGFQYLTVAPWCCQMNSVLSLASITLYLMYVMLCVSKDVEKAGKRWRWPALGSGWSELASNYQCSRSKFLPELSIALCRRWSCKKETGDVRNAVVLCANRKVVCLVLFCEKQLSAEYAKLYTECAKCDAQIALCACTKEVCTVCRAECACKKETLN